MEPVKKRRKCCDDGVVRCVLSDLISSVVNKAEEERVVKQEMLKQEMFEENVAYCEFQEQLELERIMEEREGCDCDSF